MRQSIRVNYPIASGEAEGILVFTSAESKPRPGLIMVPNWMGVTETSIGLAEEAAEKGYVVLIADLYGKQNHPQNTDEATECMAKVKNTPAETDNIYRAMEALTNQTHAAVQPNNISAYGFCLGGHTVLEFARSGADVRAVISFHGGLDTCGRYQVADIKASLLVLNGAQDPLVPPEQVIDFTREMSAAGVDWKLHSYQGAVHSFTDKTAAIIGVAEYNERVSKQAFSAMFDLLTEVNRAK